jgi:hypothetical protein
MLRELAFQHAGKSEVPHSARIRPVSSRRCRAA